MKRIVIKIGSDIIASLNEGLDTAMIGRIAGDVSRFASEGMEVVIVSSGDCGRRHEKDGTENQTD